MNENELVRKLNSVGKTAFATCFELFQKYAAHKITRENCISQQVTKGISNENGAAIRCGNAKLIFEARMECEALKLISKSNRLPNEIITKAEKLIESHCK